MYHILQTIQYTQTNKTHQIFGVYGGVGWGGGELLTCEAPVHKDLLNKMAEQHSFVLVMLTFFCIKRDRRNLCSTFQGKVCVLWSAKYGKLVIWCSSDSPT